MTDPTMLRQALLLAAAECQPKDAPLNPDFIVRVLELAADRDQERLDPVMRACRSGAVFQADLRDVLNDPAFEEVLPHLEVVLRAIEIEVPSHAV